MQLSDMQLEVFADDGWLLLKNVFSDAEVALLRREAERVYAMDRPEVFREKDGKTARTAFAAHTYNEAFRRLGRHPRLVEPVRQLLGGDVYIHQ